MSQESCAKAALRILRAPRHKRAAMKTTRTRGWLAAVAGAMFIAGCGSSEPEAMGTQPTVGTSTAGAAASPASPATANAAGAGATSVMCGAMTCTNPAASFLPTLKMFMPSASLATPCCLPSGGCGWTGSAGECTAPPDKAMCPAPSIPGFPAMLSGCCMEASQTCGIDSSAIGLGCMMPGFGGGARTRCDGTPITPPTAGTAAGTAGMSAAAAGAGGATTGAAGGGAAGMGAAAGASGGGAAGAAAGAGATSMAGRGAAGSGTSGTAGRAGSGMPSAGAAGR